MEDIRFINNDSLLVICSERNLNGKPCIFHAILHDNIITLTHKLEPSVIEKNWMPYNYNNKDYVIYRVSPFTIKSIFDDDRRIINLNELLSVQLKDYHGSTNGVSFIGSTNEVLFLIHKYTFNNQQSKILHRWLLFNPETETVRISEEFSFFKYSFLEFNCSLQYYDELYYLTLAVNEDKIYIVTFTPEMINI